jgi:subtilisin family serine protease
LPTDTNYNAFLKDSTIPYTTYYLRGSTPGTAMITVGAISADQMEYKAAFSNCGSAVDIYAPGENILSSVNSNLKGGTYDYRNDQYLICKYNGTSMATPQVTGMLACALETYPNMSHADALQYLLDNCVTGQMYDRDPVNAGDYYSLQGSPNRILHYKQERPSAGNVYPKINCKARPTVGQTWPRPRIYRYGPQT